MLVREPDPVIRGDGVMGIVRNSTNRFRLGVTENPQKESKPEEVDGYFGIRSNEILENTGTHQEQRKQHNRHFSLHISPFRENKVYAKITYQK